MVQNGDRIKILEEAYQTHSERTGKDYWNVKVELPDGSHKLAGILAMTGDLFVEAWGSETKNWIGKEAEVEIKNGFNNDYIVLHPVAEEPDMAIADEEEMVAAKPPKIEPKDLPF